MVFDFVIDNVWWVVFFCCGYGQFVCGVGVVEVVVGEVGVCIVFGFYQVLFDQGVLVWFIVGVVLYWFLVFGGKCFVGFVDWYVIDCWYFGVVMVDGIFVGNFVQVYCVISVDM